LAELRETIDDALWNTLRALDESVLLMEHMAEHLRQEEPTASTVALFMAHAQEAQQRANQIRQMVMQRPVVLSAEAQKALPGTDDELTAP
jgi:two-component system chemotaxis response regulator CheB